MIVKIVVRGETRSGKSTLAKLLAESTAQPTEEPLSWIKNRLFPNPSRSETRPAIEEAREEYTPTRQIQVTNLRWKPCDVPAKDYIKIELWDVVDEGISGPAHNLVSAQSSTGVAESLRWVSSAIMDSIGGLSRRSLQTHKDASKGSVGILDAKAVDVYKHCNGAVFIMNTKRPRSVEYVIKGLGECPKDIPVLVLASFSDIDRTADYDFIRRRLQAVRGDTSTVAPLCFAAGNLRGRRAYLVEKTMKFMELPFMQLQDGILRSSLKGVHEQSLKMLHKFEDESQECNVSKPCQKTLKGPNKDDPKSIAIVKTPSLENLQFASITEPSRARLTSGSTESLNGLSINAWAENTSTEAISNVELDRINRPQW
jgi:hypothetical protein